MALAAAVAIAGCCAAPPDTERVTSDIPVLVSAVGLLDAAPDVSAVLAAAPIEAYLPALSAPRGDLITPDFELHCVSSRLVDVFSFPVNGGAHRLVLRFPRVPTETVEFYLEVLRPERAPANNSMFGLRLRKALTGSSFEGTAHAVREGRLTDRVLANRQFDEASVLSIFRFRDEILARHSAPWLK